MLFTFPSRYYFTIGQRVVFSLGGWSPLLHAGFHVPDATRDRTPGSPAHFAYGAITLYGRPSQTFRLCAGFLTPRQVRGPARVRPSTPYRQRPRALTPVRFGLLPFRSPLLRESLSISFPLGTKMFPFPRFASALTGRCLLAGRLPHSGIPGSSPACGSPRLFAACHALLRLPLPRHPPLTLLSLTIPTRTYVVVNELLFMVGPGGLEPPPSRLSGVRSNRLSYEPPQNRSRVGRGDKTP